MRTIPLEQATEHLPELIDGLSPGEGVIITRDNVPVARLVSEKKQTRPGPGLGKGMITVLAEDDEHLKDFAEYMP